MSAAGRPKVRRTLPGHVPTAWLRPRRSAVMWLLFVVVLYDAFLLLVAPDIRPLDQRFVYAPSDVAPLLEELGPTGRSEYAVVAWADLGFIAVYSWMFVTWVRFLRIRGGFPTWVSPAMALVPAVFDTVETAGVLVLLDQPQGPSMALVYAVTIATPLKWVSVAAVIGLLAWGERRRYAKRHQPR